MRSWKIRGTMNQPKDEVRRLLRNATAWKALKPAAHAQGGRPTCIQQ